VRIWLARQAVVWTEIRGPGLGVYPAECICPGANAAESQNLVIVCDGPGVARTGQDFVVTLTNAREDTLSYEHKLLRDYGFGQFRYTFPLQIASLPPGRYDVSVESSVAGHRLRATNVMARGAATRIAEEGLGLVWTSRGDDAPRGVEGDGCSLRALSPNTGLITGLSPRTPRELRVINGDAGMRFDIFAPAPYTRFVEIP
jgi:hypothetical protein